MEKVINPFIKRSDITGYTVKTPFYYYEVVKVYNKFYCIVKMKNPIECGERSESRLKYYLFLLCIKPFSREVK